MIFEPQRAQRVFLFLMILVGLSCGCEEIDLNQLGSYVDALNIEGNRIPREHLEKDQLWMNLCIVLDCPFTDGVEISEISENNHYSLKESNLLEYNEPQVNLTYACLMKYLIMKSHEKPVKIVVHIHRNKSAYPQIDLIEDLMRAAMPELTIEKIIEETDISHYICSFFVPEKNVTLQFRNCYNHDSYGGYEGCILVVSLSLVAGLHPDLKAGDLLVPNQVVPFDLETMTLYPDQITDAENHLWEALPEVIAVQDEDMIQSINDSFRSPNPEKSNQLAVPLSMEQFQQASLAQIDGTFNPSQLPKTFRTAEKVIF